MNFDILVCVFSTKILKSLKNSHFVVEKSVENVKIYVLQKL